MYQIYYTSDAKKDFKKITQSNLKDSCIKLLKLVETNPFQNPPPYKRLKEIYSGMYSRRINIHHRLFYEIDEGNKRIKILRIWSHYGDN
ncbi:Txe/YoeB family addiction module toxin [Rickettsiaceae bacterium]|nr:Txe/YoeB family addiction module toxin [Rickettsiaceae bacterium]